MSNSIEIYRLAQENRRRLQDEARAIGINEEYISILVDGFYKKVRKNADLGPVFEHAIGDHWDEHMPKMKAFWASVVLRTGAYGGKPMIVHKALTEAKPEHFEIWLSLFAETLEETAPNQKVSDAFLEAANQMASRLRSGMFEHEQEKN